MPIVLIIGGIIIAVLTGVYFLVPNQSTPTPTAETPAVRVEEVTNEDTAATTSAAVPVDALTAPTTDASTPANEPDTTTNAAVTRTGTGTYLTPRRDEHTVDVTLTIADGIVTDAEVTFDGKPAGEVSNGTQGRFLAAYEAEVIGKPVANINLSRVGGASLTTGAFNEAVAKIAAELR